MALEFDKVPLVEDVVVVRLTAGEERLVREAIRIDILAVDFLVILLLTRDVAFGFDRTPIRGVGALLRVLLPQSSRTVDVWEAALLVAAGSCVSIIGTFMDVPFGAIGALGAEA